MAERDLQGLRSQLEQRRLQVEVVIPAEFQRQAQTIIERGLAAQTIENGAAQVEVLKAMSDAWATMGTQARELYVIQHLDQIVGAVVNSMEDVQLNQVHVIDQGDGEALAGYAASYPKMVGAVMKSLRDSTGIDVTALLSGQSTTTQSNTTKA
jgi:flotillin